MKKLLLVIPATLFISLAFSQASENSVDVGNSNNKNNGDKNSQKQNEAMANRNKNLDKLETLDITGLGGSTFTTMNYPDISSRTTALSLKVTQALLTGQNKAPGYQLVFSGAADKKPYAVETQNGTTSVFFPIEIYEIVMQKLEGAVTAKKKVQLKITQNQDGFREGVLIF